MTEGRPPRWLEIILLSLLPARDRQTISGDLHEEFRDRKLNRPGWFRAERWYIRQVLSFVPRSSTLINASRLMLTGVCFFTAMAGVWLGFMDFYLKHAGYAGREWIAATIVCQALLTLSAVHFGGSVILHRLAMLGTLPILWLAAKAAVATLTGAHMEGYVLLIALALIFQTLLTLCTLRSQKT